MRRAGTCIALLLAILMAPGASADPTLLAKAGSFTGDVDQEGALQLLHVVGRPVGEGNAATPGMTGTSGHVAGEHYAKDVVQGENLPRATVPNPMDPLGPSHTVTPYEGDAVRIELLDYQSDFTFHIFDDQESTPLQLVGSGADVVTGAYEALDTAWMTDRGIGEEAPVISGTPADDF